MAELVFWLSANCFAGDSRSGCKSGPINGACEIPSNCNTYAKSGKGV
jgi:hypothetical protein